MNSPEYPELIKKAGSLIKLDPPKGYYLSALVKRNYAGSLEEDGETRETLIEEALCDIERCLNDYEDYERAILEKGNVLLYKDPSIARRTFISLLGSSDNDVKELAQRGYERANRIVMESLNAFQKQDEYISVVQQIPNLSNEEKNEKIVMYRKRAEEDKFCNCVSFADRQFVFIVKNIRKLAGCYDRSENINWVFTLDCIPGDIVFPPGHPQVNTLYIAHPAQKGRYVPFEGAEDLMFDEKIEDFCRLSQCLGADRFHSIQGKDVSMIRTDEKVLGMNADVKNVEIDGTIAKERTATSKKVSSKVVDQTYTYEPIRFPYCPNDLCWLDADPSWQNYVKQRLEGNIITYSKKISSSEAIALSVARKKSVIASLNFLMANVDAKYNASSESLFCASDTSVWEITVHFKPLSEFKEKQGLESAPDSATRKEPAFSEKELRYKEEVMFILEGGEINDVDRRFLERKRKKMGLTTEQAVKVESFCRPSLSDEEKEYVDFFRDLMSNIEVGEKHRRMLDREARSLGLSIGRARELESSIKS